MFKSSTNNSVNVAFMGNFSFEKGSGIFPKIVKICEERKLPVRWFIFGGIGDAASLHEASRYGSVNTTGFYSEDELEGLIRRHRIDLGLILSIFPESYSKLSRECWKIGLPVIYNRIGILDEVVFSDFGIRDLPGNLEAASDLIANVCSDKKLLTLEKKRIERAVSKFKLISNNNKHDQYLKLYTDFGVFKRC